MGERTRMDYLVSQVRNPVGFYELQKNLSVLPNLLYRYGGYLLSGVQDVVVECC